MPSVMKALVEVLAWVIREVDRLNENPGIRVAYSSSEATRRGPGALQAAVACVTSAGGGTNSQRLPAGTGNITVPRSGWKDGSPLGPIRCIVLLKHHCTNVVNTVVTLKHGLSRCNHLRSGVGR